MNENKFRGYISGPVLLFLLTASLTACRVSRQPPVPALREMPVSFDSTLSVSGQDSFGRTSFRRYFPDEHLHRLIDSAMKNNNELLITFEKVVQAEAALMARRADLLPRVDAVISGGAERYGDYTLNGVGNFDTNLSPNIDNDKRIPVSPTTSLFLGLRSNWEIDLWGKLRNLRNAALARTLATREARQLLQTQLVASVAGNYYQLLANDAELRILDSNILLQEEAVEIVKIQKEGGRATELAVQQFTAQLVNTRSLRFGLLQDRIAISNQLTTLTGAYPGSISRDTLLAEPDPALIPPGLPASLLSNRPDLRQQEWLLTEARENLSAAKKAFLPSLVISPYIGLDAFTPRLLLNRNSATYGLIGGLSAPLLQRRSLKARYSIASSENREAIYRYQQSLLEAFSEVHTKINEVHNHSGTYSLVKQEVAQLRSAVAIARELYLSGYANYLEVITAQKNLLDAELRQVQANASIRLSMITLYRSLGGGW